MKRRRVDPPSCTHLPSFIESDPGTEVMRYLLHTDMAALAATCSELRAAMHEPLHEQLVSLLGFRDAMMRGHRHAIRYLYEHIPMYIHNREFSELVTEAIARHPPEFIDFLIDIDVPLTRTHADHCGSVDRLEAFSEFGIPPTRNALLVAAKDNNVDVMRYLVKNFDMSPDPDTLVLAYRQGHMQAVRYLVEDLGIIPHSGAVDDALVFGMHAGVACYLAEHSDPPEFYMDEILQYRNDICTEILTIWLRRGIRPCQAAVDVEADNENYEVLRILAKFGVHPSRDVPEISV